MAFKPLKAVITDLDGVITKTAALHAKAWKQVFDEYPEQRRQKGESAYQPFDIKKDYRDFVDGKPRYQGVSGFLESRGIRIKKGRPSDKPGWTSICAIGNRKNEIFHQLLASEGVEVFTDEDAFMVLQEWGIGILVGDNGRLTGAKYYLDDVNESIQFLRQMIR